MSEENRVGQLFRAMGDGSQPLGDELSALREELDGLVRDGTLELFNSPSCGKGVRLNRPYQGKVCVYCGSIGLDSDADEYSDSLFSFQRGLEILEVSLLIQPPWASRGLFTTWAGSTTRVWVRTCGCIGLSWTVEM